MSTHPSWGWGACGRHRVARRIARDAWVLVLGLWTALMGRAAAEAADTEPEPSAESRSTRHVVGISPFLPDEAKNEVYRRLVQGLVRDLPLASSLWVFDAYHLRTVTRFGIPDRRVFASERTRLNQFRSGIRELRDFLATTPKRPEVSGYSFEGAVRLPQFLDFVAENCRASETKLNVLVLGSPLHVDEKEPGFSMAHGFFPSDGHLGVTREKSVYGVEGLSDRLPGVVVHLGYFGDPWASDLHRDRVVRFWRLFVGGQGGRLGAVSADLPTVFAAALEAGGGSAGLVAVPDRDRANTKVEMLRVSREVGATDWISGDRVLNPAQGPPSRLRGPMRVGIRWQGDIDLDLYARPRDGAERLYFEHARSAEGYYYKDHRSSPDREFEFIEFTEPVDVRDVEVAVNYYASRRGSPWAPSGEVRVEFEGRIYSGRFDIEAVEGNRGREGRSQAAWWCRIDVPQLLGVREVAASASRR